MTKINIEWKDGGFIPVDDPGSMRGNEDDEGE